MRVGDPPPHGEGGVPKRTNYVDLAQIIRYYFLAEGDFLDFLIFLDHFPLGEMGGGPLPPSHGGGPETHYQTGMENFRAEYHVFLGPPPFSPLIFFCN